MNILGLISQLIGIKTLRLTYIYIYKPFMSKEDKQIVIEQPLFNVYTCYNTPTCLLNKGGPRVKLP